MLTQKMLNKPEKFAYHLSLNFSFLLLSSIKSLIVSHIEMLINSVVGEGLLSRSAFDSSTLLLFIWLQAVHVFAIFAMIEWKLFPHTAWKQKINNQ